MSKRVRVEGYNFNCLPGHVTVKGQGTASTLALAAGRALRDMMGQDKLKGRRVHTFQVRVSVSDIDNNIDMSTGECVKGCCEGVVVK